MIVVSNSSVLIALSTIQKLDLLKENFKKVYIPEAVWNEVVVRGEGEPGCQEVKNAGWIETKKIKNVNLVSAFDESLDKGEAEAITLALELSADLILLDEKDARLIAEKYKLKPLGTVGILVLAKKKNNIDNLKSELDKLINEGNFRISKDIYLRALKETGE